MSTSSAVPISQATIVDGLRRLGLALGDAVEVHSSCQSLGPVAGGAATVIAALMEAVGPQGAIVMSAYPVTLPLPLTEEDRARGIIAKVRMLREEDEGPTGMGIVADEFRRRSDTVLGRGSHRVCAWGRDAALHSRGYEHLLAIGGWVLLIGVDIHRCSSMHIAEDRAGVPARITEMFRPPADVRRDYPADQWYVQYGMAPADAWGRIQEEAEQRGMIRKRRIGLAECMLFRAAEVVGLYEHLLRLDPYALFGVERS